MNRNTFSTAICLLPPAEQALRTSRLKGILREAGADSAIIRDNANIYYLTGRVFCGYVYIHTEADAPLYFVRRPNHLTGEGIHWIRKVEEIPAILSSCGTPAPGRMAIGLDSLTYNEAARIAKAFGKDAAAAPNASAAMRRCRAVKTAFEQDKLRLSGEKQTRVYTEIPRMYREGMTDIEFQIEIERASRLEGCLGQFRVAGSDMELYMGNVLTGDNANTPSPYDFAMGGAGLDPSIPVGADGEMIRRGMPVMVDVNGNYTGYMTDMTRCYALGEVSDKVQHALEVSRDICRALAEKGVPGTPARDLYELARSMAEEAGLGENFMGHRSHAGFVGHGVGIEVNELPVLAPRSKDILEAGNVVAIEPKFVLPGTGAVGIENTYIVTDKGMTAITTANEAIVALG